MDELLIGIADQNCSTWHTRSRRNGITCFVSPSFGVAGALDLDGVLSLLLLDKPHLSHLDLMSVSGAVNKEMLLMQFCS